MKDHISREDAFELLKKYNKDSFHIQHALTVEGVMKWYADELGYGEDAEYWGIVGLLHDIDFELYPDQHCIKAPELLREGGVQEDIIHAVCSHGYGITVDIKPEHEMAKVLFAAGCSREVIRQGADMLGWELADLIEKTILAMRSCETSVAEAMNALEESES